MCFIFEKIEWLNFYDISGIIKVIYTEHCSVGPTNFIETIGIRRGWRFLNLDF